MSPVPLCHTRDRRRRRRRDTPPPATATEYWPRAYVAGWKVSSHSYHGGLGLELGLLATLDQLGQGIDSVSADGTVAIDNKIEQAMDLVKSHLMYAVREEVEVLKDRIQELVQQNHVLEVENYLLKQKADSDTLSYVSKVQQQAGTGTGRPRPPSPTPPDTEPTPSPVPTTAATQQPTSSTTTTTTTTAAAILLQPQPVFITSAGQPVSQQQAAAALPVLLQQQHLPVPVAANGHDQAGTAAAPDRVPPTTDTPQPQQFYTTDGTAIAAAVGSYYTNPGVGGWSVGVGPAGLVPAAAVIPGAVPIPAGAAAAITNVVQQQLQPVSSTHQQQQPEQPLEQTGVAADVEQQPEQPQPQPQLTDTQQATGPESSSLAPQTDSGSAQSNT